MFFGIDYQKDYGLVWKFGNEKKLIYWNVADYRQRGGREIITRCSRWELNPCGGYPEKTPEQCDKIIEKSINAKLF